MARRPDLIDTLLEDWASWRYIYKSLEFGTGDSVIVHFCEPRSTRSAGSVPLWQGRRTGRKLLALDNDLAIQLGPKKVAVLVAMYGTPGPIDRKARAMKITVKDLQQLRHCARRIALMHLSIHLTAEMLHRDQYRHRGKKSGNSSRPLSSVSESNKSSAKSLAHHATAGSRIDAPTATKID